MGTGSASPADLGTGRPRQFPTGGANPAKKAKMSISGAGAQGGAVGATPAQKPSNAVDAAKDAAVWASYGKVILACLCLLASSCFAFLPFAYAPLCAHPSRLLPVITRSPNAAPPRRSNR